MQGVDYDTLSVTLGSRLFMAPELIAKEGPHGAAVDIWALGVTAFYLLTHGQFPFPGRTKDVVNEKIKRHDPEMSELKHLKASAAVEFIRRCLIKDKNARPSAEQLLKDKYLCPTNPQLLRKKTSFFRTVEEINNYIKMDEF